MERLSGATGLRVGLLRLSAAAAATGLRVGLLRLSAGAGAAGLRPAGP